MTVQDAVETVHVPQPAGPADPPLAAPLATAPAPVIAPLLGRDRPMTADEREFVISLTVILVLLETFIVTGLLLSYYVWG